jgi:hypothetical protein
MALLGIENDKGLVSKKKGEKNDVPVINEYVNTTARWDNYPASDIDPLHTVWGK